MKAFSRLSCPPFLLDVSRKFKQERWVLYGDKYKQNRIKNASFIFKWPTLNKITINHYILPQLRAQTDDHCSYCDGYPLRKGDESIDHFLPKSNSDFYHLVCSWENLYLACSHCQESKVEKVDLLVLRPDTVDYSFQKYFTYNYISHEIDINLKATSEDQERAKATRKLFDFNHPAMIISRRHAFERYCNAANPILEDYNFRFMFE
ncbi:HNH endonuclease [Arsenicibacter rosenii]|uniref:HNH endonuclease n=1 Tax=Arsenicibacter rosenii TaxID=1750698 RepID=UPI0011601046|nr:hypothetical protein [Arsenicibacter rosenii]